MNTKRDALLEEGRITSKEQYFSKRMTADRNRWKASWGVCLCVYGGGESKYCGPSCLFLFPTICFNTCWGTVIYPLGGIAGPGISFSPTGSLEPAGKQIPQHSYALCQDSCCTKQASKGESDSWRGIIPMSLSLAETICRHHTVQITQKQYLVAILRSS